MTTEYLGSSRPPSASYRVSGAFADRLGRLVDRRALSRSGSRGRFSANIDRTIGVDVPADPTVVEQCEVVGVTSAANGTYTVQHVGYARGTSTWSKYTDHTPKLDVSVYFGPQHVAGNPPPVFVIPGTRLLVRYSDFLEAWVPLAYPSQPVVARIAANIASGSTGTVTVLKRLSASAWTTVSELSPATVVNPHGVTLLADKVVRLDFFQGSYLPIASPFTFRTC